MAQESSTCEARQGEVRMGEAGRERAQERSVTDGVGLHLAYITSRGTSRLIWWRDHTLRTAWCQPAGT